MKLKLYRISLIILLCLSIVLSLILGTISLINVLKFDETKMMDGIIYIICYVMLIIFTGLEVSNTIISFKHGSVYINGLAYDDNNNPNRNSIIISGGISVFSIIAVIYVILIINGVELPLSNLDIEALYFLITTCVLVFINALAVMLFPYLASSDQSLTEEQ
jgi:hypothetical protein